MFSYFDHAATSPMDPAAQEALVAELGRLGNASATHRVGQLAKRRLEDAREELAAAVGAAPDEVVFTSGGSEADSIALLGTMRARGDRHRVLVSAVEHPAVAGIREYGAEVLEVDPQGLVTESAWGLLDQDVALVSVMAVNNETGVIHPLDELVERTGACGAWSHSDAVQALGHVRLNFRELGLDLMSLSAHKVAGPVGIGALLVKRGSTPAAITLGGKQELGIRSGTSPVALAAGFAAAATAAVARLETETQRLSGLQQQIRALVLQCGGHVNGTECAPHIVSATFPGLLASDLLFLLDEAGIAASSGAACRAGVHQPSEVLLAMGASLAAAQATVRFSLGYTTTPDEVAHLARELPAAVLRARGVNSVGR